MVLICGNIKKNHYTNTEIKMTNVLSDKKFDLGLHKLFLDSFEENWQIIEED